jgi:hypothetical protein
MYGYKQQTNKEEKKPHAYLDGADRKREKPEKIKDKGRHLTVS